MFACLDFCFYMQFVRSFPCELPGLFVSIFVFTSFCSSSQRVLAAVVVVMASPQFKHTACALVDPELGADRKINTTQKVKSKKDNLMYI